MNKKPNTVLQKRTRPINVRWLHRHRVDGYDGTAADDEHRETRDKGEKKIERRED